MDLDDEVSSILSSYQESAFKEHDHEFSPYKEHCIKIAAAAVDFLQKDSTEISPRTITLIAIAAAFHEISIWTHDGWDLSYSWEEAEGYMRKEKYSLSEFNMVKGMILNHQKNVDEGASMNEAFRVGVRSGTCIKRYVKIDLILSRLAPEDSEPFSVVCR
jgi:hypothetical protein